METTIQNHSSGLIINKVTLDSNEMSGSYVTFVRFDEPDSDPLFSVELRQYNYHPEKLTATGRLRKFKVEVLDILRHFPYTRGHRLIEQTGEQNVITQRNERTNFNSRRTGCSYPDSF